MNIYKHSFHKFVNLDKVYDVQNHLYCSILLQDGKRGILEWLSVLQKKRMHQSVHVVHIKAEEKEEKMLLIFQMPEFFD